MFKGTLKVGDAYGKGVRRALGACGGGRARSSQQRGRPLVLSGAGLCLRGFKGHGLLLRRLRSRQVWEAAEEGGREDGGRARRVFKWRATLLQRTVTRIRARALPEAQ